MGLTLLAHVNENEFANSYVGFVNSMVTTFIFMSTGENMTSVIYNAYDMNALYIYYYFIVTILGLFCITAIAVGAFIEGFEKLEKENLIKHFLFKRTGAIAAFILLDVDESDALTGDEFAGLIRVLSTKQNKNLKKYINNNQHQFHGIKDRQILEIFGKIDKDFSGTISSVEFVKGIDEVFNLVEKIRNSSYSNQSKSYIKAQISWFLHSKLWNNIMLLLLVTDAFIFTLYGISSNTVEVWIDIFTFIICIICFIEILLLIFVNGFHRYFSQLYIIKM